MERQTVIVTGGSRGLGAAIGKAAGRLGANVVLVGRTIDRLEAEARGIREAGGEALIVSADVSRETDCRAVVRETLQRFGGIDGLVNNAGVIDPIAPLAEADAEAWQRSWAVNMLGPLMLTSAAGG